MPSAAPRTTTPSAMTITSYDTQPGYSVRKRLTKREIILLVLLILFLLLSIGLLVGLLVQTYVVDEKKDDVCLSPDCVLGAASLLQSMDQSYSPCEDFYSFVCEGYIKRTPVAPGTVGTEVLTSKGQENVQKIKEFMERTDPDKVPEAVAKALHVYVQCLEQDETSQDAVIKDTANLLRELGGWPIAMEKDEWKDKTKDDFNAFLANMLRMGFDTELVSISLMPDLTNSSIIRIALDQPKSSAHRLTRTLVRKRRQTEQPSHLTEDQIDNYRKIVKSMAMLLGNRDNETINADINEMLQLKKELLAIATASDHRMDYTKMYNTLSFRELDRLTNTNNAQFNWIGVVQKIFAGITTINEETEILMVMDIDFMEKLPGLLAKHTQRTLTNYVIYEGILTAIMTLFESQLSTLSEELRWSKCLETTNSMMMFAITRIFADNQDVDVNKTRVEAEAMITGIQEAFKETFEENQWLDAETKEAAPRKIENMKKFIGFPDWLFNDEELNEYYDEVEIAATPLQTYLKVLNKGTLEVLKEYRNTERENSWTMDPTSANAQYDLLSNTVWVPIGILTPPMFDSNYLAAMNYGGIGSIIGHEIGHGFDNEGSQFDENGNLRKWWSDYSLRAYANRTKCYLSQYSQYCPASFQLDSNSTSLVCIDGVNTLAENVADNIGVQASYKAYKKWVKAHGTESRLPGLMKYTPDQMFFISFARMWCENYREDQMKHIYTVDNHSPGRYRVMGTMSNFPEFAKTFGCSSGPMIRPEDKRCSLY